MWTNFRQAFWILFACVFLIGAATQRGAIVQGIVTLASYISATNSDRTHNTNPDWEHYDHFQTLTVNGVGTDALYYNMKTYRGISIDYKTTSGTPSLTIHATNDRNCVPGSCAYTDVTAEFAGAGTYTNDKYIVLNQQVLAGATWVKVEVVNGGGGTDDWTADVGVWW